MIWSVLFTRLCTVHCWVKDPLIELEGSLVFGWELVQLGNKMKHIKSVFPSIYLLSYFGKRNFCQISYKIEGMNFFSIW